MKSKSDIDGSTKFMTDKTVTEVDCIRMFNKIKAPVRDIMATAGIVSFAFKGAKQMDLYCLKRVFEEILAELKSRNTLSENQLNVANKFLSMMMEN